MPIPLPTSRRTWLAAAGALASAALGVTAVAGPAWATSGSSPGPASISAPSIPAVSTAAFRQESGWQATKNGSGSLAALKARIDKRINALLAHIDKATARAEADPNLAALAGQLSQLRQQLTTLRSEVAKATDAATVRSDVRAALQAIRSDPSLQEAAVVARADRLSMALGRLSARVPAIQARLNAAQARGTDTSQASAALSDLQAKLSDAQSRLDGLAQSVISGATTTSAARTAIQAAQADVKAIRADLWTIRQVLAPSRGAQTRGRLAPAVPSAAQL